MTRHMRGLLPRWKESMGDLVTMDDLSNEEIVSVLDDANRLLPVAKGALHLPLLEGKVLANMFFENLSLIHI